MFQNKAQDLRPPLARVKGEGSAHEGVHHWIGQRISAIALFPLGLFVLGWGKIYGGTDYSVILSSLGNPWIAGFFLLFITAASYHAALGAQIIIEDYIHSVGLRRWGLVKVRLVMFLLPIMSLVFLMRIMVLGM